MRILFEILTLIGGIAIILALAKGFPAFGHVLRGLFLNPLGLALLAGVAIFVVLRRGRRTVVGDGKESE